MSFKEVCELQMAKVVCHACNLSSERSLQFAIGPSVYENLFCYNEASGPFTLSVHSESFSRRAVLPNHFTMSAFRIISTGSANPLRSDAFLKVPTKEKEFGSSENLSGSLEHGRMFEISTYCTQRDSIHRTQETRMQLSADCLVSMFVDKQSFPFLWALISI